MEKQGKKDLKKILVSICIAIIGIGVFFGGFFVGRASYGEDIETLNYILTMYKKYYYEETDDVIGVITDALLDRYSDYFTAEEFDLIQKAYKGQREGIGVSFLNGKNKIYTVNLNSPAFNAGIKEGGTIVGIDGDFDGEFTQVSSYSQINEELTKIEVKTDFSIKIDYDGEIKTFTLQKREYVQTYLTYYDQTGAYGFTDRSGQMAFERFGENETYEMSGKEKTAVIKYDGFEGSQNGILGSAGQFKTALEKFKVDGKTDLILDIRDNGGGQMSILCEICAHLIDRKKGSREVVSIARYKDGKTTEFKSEPVDYQDYGFEKIVILANDGSASASEALIGAVLDYDKKNIVNVIVEGVEVEGKILFRTYGKGIMQTTYSNPVKGDAIKLTTAKIFWPTSNISIHDVGVTPEIEKVLGESGKGQAFLDALNLCK